VSVRAQCELDQALVLVTEHAEQTGYKEEEIAKAVVGAYSGWTDPCSMRYLCRGCAEQASREREF
jgi:hypothetical protein